MSSMQRAGAVLAAAGLAAGAWTTFGDAGAQVVPPNSCRTAGGGFVPVGQVDIAVSSSSNPHVRRSGPVTLTAVTNVCTVRQGGVLQMAPVHGLVTFAAVAGPATGALGSVDQLPATTGNTAAVTSAFWNRARAGTYQVQVSWAPGSYAPDGGVAPAAAFFNQVITTVAPTTLPPTTLPPTTIPPTTAPPTTQPPTTQPPTTQPPTTIPATTLPPTTQPPTTVPGPVCTRATVGLTTVTVTATPSTYTRGGALVALSGQPAVCVERVAATSTFQFVPSPGPVRFTVSGPASADLGVGTWSGAFGAPHVLTSSFWATAPNGSYVVTATNEQASTFAAGTATVRVQVLVPLGTSTTAAPTTAPTTTAAPTTVAPSGSLTLTPNPPTVGQPTVFRATFPGVVGGRVDFFAGAITEGSSYVDATGTATLTQSIWDNAGPLVITAVYNDGMGLTKTQRITVNLLAG